MNILDRLFGKTNKRDTKENRNRTIKVRLSRLENSGTEEVVVKKRDEECC